MKLKFAAGKLALITAIGSFTVGTILLAIYYFTMSVWVALCSYYFVAILIIINVVVLIILLINYWVKKINGKTLLKSIGFLLLNIPVGVLYFYVFSNLLNTVRLTLENKTNFTITNVGIHGCSEKMIHDLKPGEHQTVWVNIPADCSITATYIINGEKKTEEIVGYLTPMQGQKVTFLLGNNHKPFIGSY